MVEINGRQETWVQACANYGLPLFEWEPKIPTSSTEAMPLWLYLASGEKLPKDLIFPSKGEAGHTPTINQMILSNGVTKNKRWTSSWFSDTNTLVVNNLCMYMNRINRIENLEFDNCNNISLRHRWLIDSLGRIHNGQDSNKCLQAINSWSQITIATCSDDSKQAFTYDGKFITSSHFNQVLDKFSPEDKPGLWNRHGGTNQIWSNLKEAPSENLP